VKIAYFLTKTHSYFIDIGAIWKTIPKRHKTIQERTNESKKPCINSLYY